MPLGLGQAGQRGVGDGLEEIGEPRERELRFGLDRPAREHAEAVPCGREPALVPKRGLPDADNSLEHEDGRAPADVGREPGQAATLGLAAYEQPFFGRT